jgi:tRNA 2-thiouridine synthesizing protein A
MTRDPAKPFEPFEPVEPFEVLDCRGQRCPLPVIALARRLPQLPAGAILRVLADDPAAANDIAAWCRMRAQDFLGSPAPATFDIRHTL